MKAQISGIQFRLCLVRIDENPEKIILPLTLYRFSHVYSVHLITGSPIIECDFCVGPGNFERFFDVSLSFFYRETSKKRKSAQNHP